MEIEGLDDTEEQFSEMEVTISIFSVQDDEDDDDLPVGATQCPRCRQLYAGVFCPNCFMQSGLAQLR
jgi:predicted hydrocarbon binding protein